MTEKEKNIKNESDSKVRAVDIEEMKNVTGGWGNLTTATCPQCGGTDCECQQVSIPSAVSAFVYTCKTCGYTWNKKIDSGGGDGSLF